MDSITKKQDMDALAHCDFIKVILMTLVVIGHCAALWGIDGWFNTKPSSPSVLLTFITTFVGEFHIFTFVLVSGYLYSYLKFEKGRYTKFDGFIKSKAKRLLVPFVFTALFWTMPFHWYFFDSDIIDLSKKFIFAQSPAQLWFLMMLFVVFIFAWFMPRNMIDSLPIGFLSCLIIYGCSSIVYRFIPNYFQISTAMQCFLYFWIGMQIRKHERSLILRKIPTILWFIIYLLYVVAYLCVFAHSESLSMRIVDYGMRIVRRSIGSIMGFYLLLSCAKKIHYQDNKVFNFFSEYNFPIYLFHQQWIYCVITLLNGKCNPYLMALASFIVSTVLSAIMAYGLGKFNVTRALIGLKPTGVNIH